MDWKLVFSLPLYVIIIILPIGSGDYPIPAISMHINEIKKK